jgi:acyl-CoA synthetase (NDP forming)
MVHGRRELIAGIVRDPQLGPCVMLGVGGIFAEAVGDVAFATAPVTTAEAHGMIAGLRSARLLDAFRGEPPVDRDELAAILVGLGRLAVERPDVASVDVNPLVVREGRPVAVDALVGARRRPAGRPLDDAATLRARFAPLFHPRGIIVAGRRRTPASSGSPRSTTCCASAIAARSSA